MEYIVSRFRDTYVRTRTLQSGKIRYRTATLCRAPGQDLRVRPFRRLNYCPRFYEIERNVEPPDLAYAKFPSLRVYTHTRARGTRPLKRFGHSQIYRHTRSVAERDAEIREFSD